MANILDLCIEDLPFLLQGVAQRLQLVDLQDEHFVLFGFLSSLKEDEAEETISMKEDDATLKL